MPTQMTFADDNPEYAAFLEKFKPKKTTDDCLTPPNVYDAVCGWVERRYGVRRESFVRPFWPGGDYERFDYPQGCVVVDNPPFSILARIVRFYHARDVGYFLFCPYLTSFQVGIGLPCCHVFAPADITYANGARVPTCFVTSLDPGAIFETAPDLLDAVNAAERENRNAGKRLNPRYDFPPEVVTPAICGRLCEQGVSVRIPATEAAHIPALDAMRRKGKSIFGGGYLVSERAVREIGAAVGRAREKGKLVETRVVWELSDREREILRMLGSGAAD